MRSRAKAACPLFPPAADGARLVWADATGGERGELVVLQCELAADGLSVAEASRLRRRQHQLLTQHGREWSGLQGLASRCAFHRGFVESAEFDAGVLASRAEEIVTAAPLLSTVHLTGLGQACGPRLTRVVEHPLLRQLTGLALEPGAVHDAVQALSSTGALGRLNALQLQRGITAEALETLAPACEGLEQLELRETVELDQLTRFFTTARLPRLTSVDLGSWAPDELSQDWRALFSALPPALRALRVWGLDGVALAELAETPLAPQLERLALPAGRAWREPSSFAAFTNLRSLDLGHFSFGATAGYEQHGGTAVAAFTACPLPRLRELRVSFGGAWAEELLELIGAAFGSGLELLELRGMPAISPRARAAIGCEVIEHRPNTPALLIAGRAPCGRWLDPPVVELQA